MGLSRLQNFLKNAKGNILYVNPDRQYKDWYKKIKYCINNPNHVKDMGEAAYPDRSWGVGNNPKTAVWEYLKKHPEFEINKSIDHKLLISVAPDGYLKRVR